MKRLTKRLDCGRVAIFSAEDGEEYIPQAVLFRDAVDRLAAYEDKGVEPEDMLSAVEMAKAVCKLTVADAYIATGLMPERVAELAQAEWDGRLVVMPEGGDTAVASTADPQTADVVSVRWYIAAIRWMWENRNWANTRQKWKAFDRAMKGAG